MKLYLSGAQVFKGEQRDVNQSLGGFMSSTPVPNKKLNGIFADVSLFNLKEKTQNVLAIFLYNEGAEAITNITIQNIYQVQLGKYINQCDFEFAAVEMNENGTIELIGSQFEEPFYAEWFDCESRYEDCSLKLLAPGEAGDEFSIFGLIGTLSGNSIKTLQKDLIDIINSSDFIKAEPNGDDSIYIKSTSLVATNQNSDFLTSGNANVQDADLTNGKDGETLISDSLEPGKGIGLWIKRKINDRYKEPCETCVNLSLPNNVVKKEVLELVFNHD